MKNIYPFFYFFILFSFSLAGQTNISLEEIWNFNFYPQTIEEIQSMNDGEHYTILTGEGLDKYAYRSLAKEETMVAGKFSAYVFSNDEKLILLETKPTPIYRRSKTAIYLLFNIENKSIITIYSGKPIQAPLLSPNNEKIAFVYENNLYVQDLKSLKVTQITKDGEKNKIINGVTDWVYEEEFGFVRAFDWSPDSNFICYLRFDERQVPEFDLTKYAKQLYPETYSYKYPKAGEKNALVNVRWYNMSTDRITTVNLKEYKDFYVPIIKYSKSNNLFFIGISNRLQNQMDLISINTQTGKSTKVFIETDKAYIETDNLLLSFLYDNSFIWQSERDGYRHLYHYTEEGELIKKLTHGNYEVTNFYGVNENDSLLYFQSNENGSNNRGVYVIDLTKDELKPLAVEKGINEASFSKNFAYFINEYSNLNSPPVFTLNQGKTGRIIRKIMDNQEIHILQKQKKVSKVELMEIPVNGETLNAWIIKPTSFNKTKKYPLFITTYGGPGSQETLNKWDYFNYWWYQSLAQQGIIVACIDNRGTGGKGSAFKKSTYMNLGEKEVADQIAAAKYVSSFPYIASDRIGIFGWSYGGYLSLLALEKGNDTFKLAIAVAPVTNWRFYDTIYTERFLRTPQENPTGYDENSPIKYVDQIKGKLLLIHGSTDDNVHVQNTYEMTNALIEANKDFDLMIYPDKNHGIYGGNTRLHLYKKMNNFLLNNL